MMENAEIAIIDANTLSCIGLKTILDDVLPSVSIMTFGSFEDFVNETPEKYIHYFVSLHIYMEHTTFFLPLQVKTIVMASENQYSSLVGLRVLNIDLPEKELIKQLLMIQQTGHHKHPSDTRIPHFDAMPHILSSREAEVLVLVVKGLINKEIADKLHISLSTVISHRKNITEKLGIKSVSKLTIYAVMNGYVEADKI
jgi:DNA-binding CsgD family transcriptional regulator